MKALALLSISASLVSSVGAWGTLGHQTVALLAQKYLLPKTIKGVQNILNDTTPSYMGNVALWADQFRSQPGEGWSAQLHYINANDPFPPDSCVIHEMDCPEGGCVTSALANYTARVQDKNLDVVQRNQALKFIIHFMGDIAQPLHTEAFGGGVNNLTVFFNGFKTNMHAAWDTSIPNSILSLEPTTNITMDNSFILASQLDRAIRYGQYRHQVDDWICSWHIQSRRPYSLVNSSEAITTTFAQESNDFVCSYALSSPNGPDSYNGTEISGGYSNGAVPIVKLSLARAGVRLAAWLNLIFTGRTGF